MTAVGRTISHYEILDRLGGGGMGVVFRARDLKLDRVVAIKFLPPHSAEDERARARFIAEAKAASALDHPNIGTIYEIDETPSAGLFIVMAYYPGQSLAQRLEHGALEMLEALDIAISIAAGLSRAHEHGIVHRDIKPGNVMLTTDGGVKIVDFGLAKVQNVQLTDDGIRLGTPAFMSPEQTRGETVDHRTDIWALGVLLYQMVAGRPPFAAPTVWELLQNIRDATPAPLPGPPELRTVVERTLSKRPSDRYQTARALGNDLDAVKALCGQRSAVEQLSLRSRGGTSETAATFTTVSESRSFSTAERRQLTVLSCQVVDFPAIAEQLGTEQAQEVLLEYHRTCEQAVQAFEGHVAHCLDADVSVHFGYPSAHEDDAWRAVTAGLAIADRVGALNAALNEHLSGLRDHPLTVRVGIHTGPVVTGDARQGGRQRNVVGITGTLAGKARDSASSGQVVITEDTERLVRGFFDLQPIGVAQIAGVARPLALHAVAGRTSAANRVEAAASGGLSALIGRDRELGLLVDRWDEVKDGSGQVVLVIADPGVGKSRLVAAVKDHVAGAPHALIECRCSPYQRNTPFAPVVEMLGRLFLFARADSGDQKLEKLRAGLARHGQASPEALYLFAALLLVPLPDASSRPNIPPQRQRERTLGAVLNLLLALSSERPLLLAIEDLHWVDPTTLELLGLVVDQGPTAPILTVLTFRPEFTPPWGSRAHLTQLSLNRLSRRESEHMVQRLAGKRRLPQDVLARIVSNADGVPLYVEELTKAVLESGLLRATEDAYELTGTLDTLAIPTTLADSLMARLDRLGTAKEIAQIASVLGRTFPYELLLAVSRVEESFLRDDLSRLVGGEFLFQRGVPPDAKFTFKHALVKDAAYQSLLLRTRQELHERVAHTLEQQFPEMAQTQPELLAHHFTDAGRIEPAVTYWQRAGRTAMARSANLEAAAHFGRGLELLESLPESREHTQQCLDLLIALGGAKLSTMGYGAPDVGRAFTRARELSEQVGESRQLFDALQGIWAFSLVRAELQEALDLADRLVGLADRLSDSALQLEASLRKGITLSVLGRPATAAYHLEQVVTASLNAEHGSSASMYGQDRLVAALCHLSVVQWLLGEPDTAVESARKALVVAQGLAHPFSISWAYLYLGIVHSLRWEPPAVREHAEALASLCTEQGFAYRLAQSHILRDWALAVGERDAEALDRMQAGIGRARATGAEVYRPYYLALHGDACLRHGRTATGLESVHEGLEAVARTGERFMEAELRRLHGHLLLSADPSRRDEATASVRLAAEIAREQGARSLEMRAQASVSRSQPTGAD